MTRIATVAMNVDPRDIKANLAKIEGYIDQAAEEGVDLIVFPEMAISGYGEQGMMSFSAADKLFFQENAELIPEGPSTQLLICKAQQHEMYIACGICELDPERFNVTYNACVLVGPEGFVGKARKVHLPLCERLLHKSGSEFPVFDTALGKIGLQICFDICHPEVTRTLGVKGAEIVVSPIAWPNFTRTLDDPDHKAIMVLSHARALENMVFFVTANHCNPPYEGFSQILGPTPDQVCAATGFDEEMVVADVDIRGEINRARMVSMGGSDLLRDRMPHMYGTLVEESRYSMYCRAE